MSWDDPGPIGGDSVEAGPRPGGVVPSGLALPMGIASILMSYVLVAHFAYIVHHFVFYYPHNAPNGDSWRSVAFGVTSPWFLTGLLGWLTVAWCLGYAGYRIAQERRSPGRPSSLAATAARFSLWGLVGCGLDLAILLGMLAYRWTR